MNILDVLKSSKIRYSRGKYFDAQTLPGERIEVDDMGELEKVRRESAKEYVGSAFVTFGQELPAAVPVNDPAHCWAEAVVVGGKYVGALVTWSTDQREAAHRATRPQVESFSDFNARRHGHE